MKKILLGVAGMVCGLALVFSIAAPAQAAALTSAQVQAIIGLLQSFGADASIVANVQATLTGQPGTYPTYPVTGTRICPQIIRTLSQGDSGSDVADLQAYLGVSQTGYFGPMTAQAVASFQSDEGLSQVGIVGPQTRAAFARRCGGGGGSNYNGISFQGNPNSGQAPLTVSFLVQSVSLEGTYSIDFGDGASANVQKTPCVYTTCPNVDMIKTSHTYTSTGTYTAKLLQTTYACQTNSYPPTLGCPTQTTVGSATVTVSGSTSGGAPSINGLDSPTSLNVGQTGTWTVHASAPSGTQLRYSVVWGDERWGATTGSAQQAQSNVQTSASFSHAYQNAGTYTPTFYVSNNYGSVQTSASVVVGGNTQAVIFSANPTSGTAPLAVVFSVNSVTGYDISGFSIDFGDGQTGDPQTIYCFAAPCNPAMTASHTYAAAGTYYAKLMYQPPYYCPSGAYCTMMMPAPQTVGSVTITVTGGTISGTISGTFSASPTSGFAPLGVTFTTNVSGATIDFGDGTSAKVSSNCTAGLTSSTNCNTGSYFASHYYQSAGTYTATIKRIIGVREIYGGGDTNIYETIGTVTITVMTGWL